MLYFDHSATTPPYPEVIETVAEVMREYYGNPASIHGLGVEAERLLQAARENMSKWFGCKPEELIFTSGGTESNNLAIKGVAMQYRERGRHLITTEIEHSSVYECFRQLEHEGFRVTYLPVDDNGRIRLSDLKEALCNDTILVSVMHVNNEMGAIQPIEQVGQTLRAWPRIIFHVDAVQSVGKIPVHPSSLGIDLLSISAHKFRGPKGIGALYSRHGITLYPQMAGGGQEYGVRSGTSNVPLIAGMAKAFRMSQENLKHNRDKLYSLRKRLLAQLEDIPGMIYNGSADVQTMAPHIVNISFPGMRSEVIVHALEQHGIYISTKSACSSGENRPSRILLAMGMDEDRAASALRVSLAAEQKEEEIDLLALKLRQVVKEMK